MIENADWLWRTWFDFCASLPCSCNPQSWKLKALSRQWQWFWPSQQTSRSDVLCNKHFCCPVICRKTFFVSLSNKFFCCNEKCHSFFSPFDINGVISFHGHLVPPHSQQCVHGVCGVLNHKHKSLLEEKNKMNLIKWPITVILWKKFHWSISWMLHHSAQKIQSFHCWIFSQRLGFEMIRKIGDNHNRNNAFVLLWWLDARRLFPCWESIKMNEWKDEITLRMSHLACKWHNLNWSLEQKMRSEVRWQAQGKIILWKRFFQLQLLPNLNSLWWNMMSFNDCRTRECWIEMNNF